MFQHARAGQRAFLGDVTDQKDRRTALFRVTHQQGSTFANLRHAARCGLQLLGEDRLDRVDHHHLGLLDLGRGDDGFDAGFGHDAQLVLRQAQTPSAHGDLLLGFFASDIQRRHALGDIAEGLQQNRRLARPPPSTRSSSAELVEKRGISSTLTSARVLICACEPVQPVRPLGGAAAPLSIMVSTSVFQAPQSAHWPAHLGNVAPHSVQPYKRLALAMTTPVVKNAHDNAGCSACYPARRSMAFENRIKLTQTAPVD